MEDKKEKIIGISNTGSNIGSEYTQKKINLFMKDLYDKYYDLLIKDPFNGKIDKKIMELDLKCKRWLFIYLLNQKLFGSLKNFLVLIQEKPNKSYYNTLKEYSEKELLKIASILYTRIFLDCCLGNNGFVGNDKIMSGLNEISKMALILPTYTKFGVDNAELIVNEASNYNLFPNFNVPLKGFEKILLEIINLLNV